MITGDFVNGLHLMVGKNSDMENGSPKVTETSENTFFLNWESGDIFVFSEGEWAAADSAVAGIVAALLNKGALPAVTSADNGKVLGVDDGVWTPVEGGGGSDPRFTVTFSISGNTPSCNKTFSQISTAISDGKLICPEFNDSDGFLAHADMLEVQCWFVSEVAGVPTWLIFSIDDTDTVTVVQRPIGNALNPTEVAVSGTTPTIAAADNHIYKCGEVSSLTITGGTTGEYIVVFTSGATPTVLNLPQALDDMMPDGFSVEANTKYEINVLDGWPFVGKKAAVSA